MTEALSREELEALHSSGVARYRDFLVDDSTFSSMTLEELLDAGALPSRTTAALRERYLLD